MTGPGPVAVRRGEIYFADLDPVRGREQSGRRPVLVVSSDVLNRRGLVVSVVAGTDSRNVERAWSTNVHVSAAESGLPRDTVFLCFQIRSIDPSRFLDPARGGARRAGRLPAERLREVDSALRRVLELGE